MRKVVFGILAAFASAGAAHAEQWVVEGHYADRAALQRAARHFEHVIVDSQRNVLRVETTDAGIAALGAEGLDVTIDQGEGSATTVTRVCFTALSQNPAHSQAPRWGRARIVPLPAARDSWMWR